MDESRRYHYWIIARDEKGQTILIYGAPDEQTARMRGLEMLPGVDFVLKRLPTRDLGRASSLLKGSLLEETHDLKRATRRLRHTVGRRGGKPESSASAFGGGMTPW